MSTRKLCAHPWALLLCHCVCLNLVGSAVSSPTVGFASRQYDDAQWPMARLEVKVGALTSTKTQVPYDYYFAPFCRPHDIMYKPANLGMTLSGETMASSPYRLDARVAEDCKIVCKQRLGKNDVRRLRWLIDEDYWMNWFLDSIPAVHALGMRRSGGSGWRGFPVGFKREGKYYLHNHVRMDVFYDRMNQTGAYEIVGFGVQPESIRHHDAPSWDGRMHGHHSSRAMCRVSEGMEISEGAEVYFTFDISWHLNSPVWSYRWNPYSQGMSGGGEIQYFSIMNSMFVLVFLLAVTAISLRGVAGAKLAAQAGQGAVAGSSSLSDDSGWRCLHGDVFRRPSHSRLLAVSVGTGLQLLVCMFIVLVLMVLGVMSPLLPGTTTQGVLLFFALTGPVAGYSSVRVRMIWAGAKVDAAESRRVAKWTAGLYPGIGLAIFAVLNLMLMGVQSSAGRGMGGLVPLLALWFCIMAPFVLIGAFMAERRGPVPLPVKTHVIPRPILTQPWYSRIVISSMILGVLPFGCVFTQTFFILSSMWWHIPYLHSGFLLIVFILLIAHCATISMAIVYHQLTQEDYSWPWRSFLTPAASAAYIMMYSCLFLSTRLSIDYFVGKMLFFGYMFLFSLCFALLTGSVGFISAFVFVRAVYSPDLLVAKPQKVMP